MFLYSRATFRTHPSILSALTLTVFFQSTPEVGNRDPNDVVIRGVEVGSPMEDGFGNTQFRYLFRTAFHELSNEELQNGA